MELGEEFILLLCLGVGGKGLGKRWQGLWAMSEPLSFLQGQIWLGMDIFLPSGRGLVCCFSPSFLWGMQINPPASFLSKVLMRFGFFFPPLGTLNFSLRESSLFSSRFLLFVTIVGACLN